MKFANLVIENNKKMENIGDWIQLFAIDYLYSYMHVDDNEIIKIKISELSTYDGEYVILPINYPFYGYYQLSYKIIPVFLGISIINGSVAKGLRMQAFQPIGCRDLHSLKAVQEMGLEAYMGGCLTITFPKRKKNMVNGKIFIVDLSEKVLAKVPQKIKENATYVSHVLYNEECLGREGVKDIYKRYCEEASLVITSRIHCAQPCLAMGIPVIFICEIPSFRYDVLRQYVPIYTLESMEKINWNPKPVELEEHKTRLLKNAASRVKEIYNKYEKITEISSFFLEGESYKYEIDSVWAFQKYIKNRWKKNDVFLYSFWGVTQIADEIFAWISENYPNAVLNRVFDKACRTVFHGIMPEALSGLNECTDEEVVFVTAGSVNPVADDTLKKAGVKNYVICYGNLYIVNGVELSY